MRPTQAQVPLRLFLVLPVSHINLCQGKTDSHQSPTYHANPKCRPKAFAKIIITKTISTINMTGIILIFKCSYHWKSYAIVCDHASRLTRTSLAQKHLSAVQSHLSYQRNSYILIYMHRKHNVFSA